MSQTFKVGDTIKVASQEDFALLARAYPHRFKDIEQLHQVLFVDNSGCVGLENNTESEWYPSRFVKVVPTVVKEDAPASRFIAARQKAWDAYAASRARVGNHLLPNGNVRKGFNEGYNLGVLEGIKHARSQQAAFLPSEGLARSTDPVNSQEAAGIKVKRLLDLITKDLRDNGPGTAWEIANRLGLPLNTVSPRFATLRHNGICHISGGQKVGRSNRSIYAIGNGVQA